MKDAKDLIPWTVTDISIRPYEGYWSMNPSIHFDGQTWRCSLRCTDYAMPDGVTIRSKKAGPGHQSKNAMIVLDPQGWKVVETRKMHEHDTHPRVACANVGYEDMRIFKTDRGGLQGIAASLHLARDTRPAAGGAQHQPPEQVLLSFDAEYNIVAARPIRGDWWSGTAQKNWVPFDGAAEQRFLYSIGKGTMFDDRGVVHGDAARVKASASARAIVGPSPALVDPECAVHEAAEQERAAALARQEKEQHDAEKRARKDREREEQKKVDPRARMAVRGADASVRRTALRLSHDTVTSRPSYTAHHPSARRVGGRVNTESARTTGGRTLMPRYEGLRGGTQLVHVAENAWLGVGHEMQFLKGKKFYYHTWYLVDDGGKLKRVSASMKLAAEGIEFAAGMAIDSDRLVVSFGVDDMYCRLGETKLSAVMEILRPVED